MPLLGAAAAEHRDFVEYYMKVTRAQMVAARRYVIVVIFIIAAIVTPPDPGSQIILAVPLWLLFEAALFLMRWQEGAVEADRAARLAEEGEAAAAE